MTNLSDEERAELRELCARVVGLRPLPVHAVAIVLRLLDESAALAAEVERLRARRFPVMDGISVLWSFVAPHERQAQENHDQSLEKLASRGGLGIEELYAVVHGLPYRAVRKLDAATCKTWLLGVVAAEDETKRDLAAARELLDLGSKYVVEDRAVTPGSTRLARWVERVRALLGTDGSGG